MDHRYHKTVSASVPVLTSSSAPYRSLARASPTASALSDDNQDPPLLYWADDGLSSLIQPPFPTKCSARNPSEAFSITPVSSTSYGSPSENGFGHRSVRSSRTCTGEDEPPSPRGPVTHLYKKRRSINPNREYSNANGCSKAGGLLYNENPPEVGLEGSVETEIYSLLEELTDYHLKSVTVTSVPLLTLPNELSPTDGPTHSQPHADNFFPPLVTPNVSYNGDSDTPSLTPPSPQSSKDSHYSSASLSPKSKTSFTSATPSTDRWKRPLFLATVPKRETSTSDHFGDSYPSVSSGGRRGYRPPLATTIPEDSTIGRRDKGSMSSKHAVTHDHSRSVGASIDYPVSSRFSDDDTSEVAEVGYIDSGFNLAHSPPSPTVSSRFTQPSPRPDVPSWSGSGSLYSVYSPRSSIRPDFLDYPPPSPSRYTPSPKRNMFQSLFSQNSTSEQKEERKRAKGRDTIQRLSRASRSMDALSFTTTSSKSSRNKERKSEEKAEKAAKKAQLAAKLKAKQLQGATDESLSSGPRPTGAGNGPVLWEEKGGMYSADAFL